jgi:hypothetical protein
VIVDGGYAWGTPPLQRGDQVDRGYHVNDPVAGAGAGDLLRGAGTCAAWYTIDVMMAS